MISLGDLLSFMQPQSASSAAPTALAPQDREAYLQYTEMVMVKGGKPLPYADWVKAGRPAS